MHARPGNRALGLPPFGTPTRSGAVLGRTRSPAPPRAWLWLLSVAATTAFGGQPSITLTGLFPPSVDHRLLQSPVKSQGSRGTCTAFSVAAVMETFDGVPANLSEQGAYGYIKLQELGAGDVGSGGLLANYPELLGKVGFMHESVAPYDPKSGLWSKDDSQLKKYLEEGKTGIADLVKRAGSTRYCAEPRNVVFLKDDDARDVSAIKRLLVTGHRAVAVGYTHLYAPYWMKYKSGVITPSEGFLFAIGEKAYSLSAAKSLRPRLIDEAIAGTVAVRLAHPDEPDDYGGHAVTVVGYNPDGFIIKNSWSRDWGMQGYAVVSFDYHRLFCDEALAVKEPSIYVNPGTAELRPVIYLKSRPVGTGPDGLLRLSLFGPREGGVAGLRSLRFELYEQDSAGLRGPLVEFPPPSAVGQATTGYSIDVLRGRQPAKDRSGRKYWVQVTFGEGTQSMERIVTFPNVTWSNNEYRGH